MYIQNYTYLLILLAIAIAALVFGFRKKTGFRHNIRYLIPAILFSGIIFILWDYRFIQYNLWEFNPSYILGIHLSGVPLEEWLYYLIIPMVSVYVYELVKQKQVKIGKPNTYVAISMVLVILFALTAYFGRHKLYTFFTFFLLAIYFGYTTFRNRFKQYMKDFYLAFMVLLLPVFLFYVILTALPILIHDPEFTLGLFIYTVPVEDLARFFLMFLINVTIYEYLKNQRLY